MNSEALPRQKSTSFGYWFVNITDRNVSENRSNVNYAHLKVLLMSAFHSNHAQVLQAPKGAHQDPELQSSQHRRSATPYSSH